MLRLVLLVFAGVLPWRAGTPVWLTQDCDEGDHADLEKYAYDWTSSDGAFAVSAARGGTITHLKINSRTGCDDPQCIDDANVLVIDHGDGTQSIYLHLAADSLAPGIACGSVVKAGQALAVAGSTGWSNVVHLHFQVTAVRAFAPRCECGTDGRGCDPGYVPWSSFWSSTKRPTLPVSFTEWPDAASCADRRLEMPAR